MKISLIIIICFTCLCSCYLNSDEQKKANKTASQPVDSVDFVTHIQPILLKNCSPCHFPDGKMYERLPFDKAKTIVNHNQGVLKRFKNEELALLKQFVKQNQPD